MFDVPLPLNPDFFLFSIEDDTLKNVSGIFFLYSIKKQFSIFITFMVNKHLELLLGNHHKRPTHMMIEGYKTHETTKS